MRPVVVKVTSKNQVTLPDVLMRELGRPSHFKAFVQEGNLVLFSARLATYDEQAKEAGVPPAVLKRAYALAAERRAAATAEQHPPVVSVVEEGGGS
uniref:hypothetical protein n=1 Tax=uncultured Sphingomonas sp. TaxID=158754 RepID=UPI0025E6F99C|nr:hypothetical protein [uncultured Sphingomonas sp.]